MKELYTTDLLFVLRQARKKTKPDLLRQIYYQLAVVHQMLINLPHLYSLYRKPIDLSQQKLTDSTCRFLPRGLAQIACPRREAHLQENVPALIQELQPF